MSLQKAEISIKRISTRVRNNLYIWRWGREREKERGRENCYAILLCPPVQSRGREQTAFSWARINPRLVLWPSKNSLCETVRSIRIIVYAMTLSALDDEPSSTFEPFLFAECPSGLVKTPIFAQY